MPSQLVTKISAVVVALAGIGLIVIHEVDQGEQFRPDDWSAWNIGGGILVVAGLIIFALSFFIGKNTQLPHFLEKHGSALIYTAIVGSCLIGVAVLRSGDDNDDAGANTRREQYRQESIAIEEAQKNVRNYLKYPHDAEFSLLSTGARFVEDRNWWVVVGKVKAKNAIGNTLTHEYRAIFVSDEYKARMKG